MLVNRFAFLAVSLTLACISGGAQSWHVTNTFHPGGEGGWDYVTVDASSQRLFVTRSTHTQVIDSRSGKLLGDITGQVRSHGVALVPKLNRGFITDGGGSGAIFVFDLKTYKVLGRIPTMPDSDGIIYDPGTDLVLAVSGDGNSLMTFHPDIDPKNGKVTKIALGGAPEFLSADGSGKVYVNLEDKDLVAVVDLHANKVLNRWSVAPGGSPVGMAIDSSGQHLFIGCRKPQKVIVMSTATGKVEDALPIGAGNDAVGFDHGQAFASCGDGSLAVIGNKAGHFEVLQSVKTAPGARTLGIDPMANQIFLPTAEMLPAEAGKRPQPKPGSFELVVVSQ
ncbi:YncE family protein [Occallatibacter savannae]|uniref:YncE family protein n=1 Tax=Occallatibacter savannae TaxID=1002691 RepID=UPI000D69E12A|nr:YncE family protein [Occallatibacter savannae]